MYIYYRLILVRVKIFILKQLFISKEKNVGKVLNTKIFLFIHNIYI